MLATVASASLLGVRGHAIRVEVHVGQGLPAFSIVGLPDASCREARDRVRAAIASSKLGWPDTRITVNLAPSGLRKAGAGLDLAIALGILGASKAVPVASLDGLAFIGELGLDGSIRSVHGVLPLTAAVPVPRVVVAPANHAEAELVPGVEVRSASTLSAVVDALKGELPWPSRPPSQPSQAHQPAVDLALVQGQPVARAALEIAAAGGHHLLMIGPPGSGKTMLARALVDILPALEPSDALDVTAVHSAAGLPLPAGVLVARPPFRAPHHTSSMVSLVGGGTQALRPGEISCAHAGVLFLDEMGEFPAAVLDALRQPLEEGVVRIARAYGAATLPARVQLVAAMNPCPCGDGGRGPCRCSELARQRYSRRVSGPLLDRFDLRVHVDRPPAAALFATEPAECSADVAARVASARARIAARGLSSNASIGVGQLDELAPLVPEARALLQRSMEQGRLSARGVHRVRRVARTIADLAGQEGSLERHHVSAALALRSELAGLSAPVAS